MSTQQTTKASYQGKYGYHICSYEQFQYMKHAHKLFYQAIVDRRKWQRWAKKDQINRDPTEPFCYHNNVLDQKMRSYKYNSLRHSNDIGIYMYGEVLRQYQLCKKPYQADEIEEVWSKFYRDELWNDSKFKDLISKIEDFYQNRANKKQ